MPPRVRSRPTRRPPIAEGEPIALGRLHAVDQRRFADGSPCTTATVDLGEIGDDGRLNLLGLRQTWGLHAIRFPHGLIGSTVAVYPVGDSVILKPVGAAP